MSRSYKKPVVKYTYSGMKKLSSGTVRSRVKQIMRVFTKEVDSYLYGDSDCDIVHKKYYKDRTGEPMIPDRKHLFNRYNVRDTKTSYWYVVRGTVSWKGYRRVFDGEAYHISLEDIKVRCRK